MLRSLVYKDKSFIGEAEIRPENGRTRVWTRGIRTSHLSQASDRCPPLAVLCTIAADGFCFKMESTVPSDESPMAALHAACLREKKAADEDVANWKSMLGQFTQKFISSPRFALNLPVFPLVMPLHQICHVELLENNGQFLGRTFKRNVNVKPLNIAMYLAQPRTLWLRISPANAGCGKHLLTEVGRKIACKYCRVYHHLVDSRRM